MMSPEQRTLRIKAERLGTVTEVKNLLSDLDNAYNSIYAFHFLVDSLEYDRERNLRLSDERFHRLRQYWKEISNRKDLPNDPFFFEMFLAGDLYRQQYTLPNLIELQSKIDFEKIILPNDRLVISRVNIQSPGFWEFIGSLNPLLQIREYLKDRHERKKDKAFRNRQEEIKGDLENEERQTKNLQQKIQVLKSLGYSDIEIRQLVANNISNPLKRLNKHQDNGQIETPEDPFDGKTGKSFDL